MLNAAFQRTFAAHAEAPALLSQDGQVLSFGKVGAHVRALAARLHAEGARSGDTVAPLADNRVLRILLRLALFRLGARVALVAAPAPLAARGERIDFAVCFADQAAEGVARRLVFAPDWFEPPTGPEPPPVEPAPMLVATSGSTGAPRFLRLAPEAVLARAALTDRAAGPSAGACLISMPESTGVAGMFLTRALLAGHGAMGMQASPAETLAAARGFGVREMALTPLALAELLAALGPAAPAWPVARIFVAGGAAEAAALARAEAEFGAEVFVYAGATETGPFALGRFARGSFKPGWTGRLLPEVEAATRAEGRLALRVPQALRAEGYVGGPAAFDAEGWFQTGDLARLLPEGALILSGRADNLINLGGGKFSAELVEMLAGQCPGVAQSAATRLIPVDGAAPDLGLAVVAGPGFEAEQVRLFLAAKLHTPARIRVHPVARLPQLPSGKLDRGALPGLFD
jgi:acyl-coenzyme A synthetase/AMP-(fatty) acid ligase